MEKKRPVGITVISIIDILLGILLLLLFIISCWSLLKGNPFCGFEFFWLIFGLPLLQTGLRSFRFYPKAHMEAVFSALLIKLPFGMMLLMIIGYSFSDSILGYVGISFIVWGLISFFYFTRPKVKEQFLGK